jgi:hypothetical protein
LSSIATIIYGILPFSQGFLYYTLTEGITPALFLTVLYFAMKTFNEKEIRVQLMYLFFASSFFSFLIIVRPFMIVFLPFILVILFLEWFRTKGMRTVLLNLLLFTSISLSGLFTWQIRGGLLLGKSLGLHPIYQNEIPSDLEEGKLYISRNYHTAVHLCACGCKGKVITPLISGFWNIIENTYMEGMLEKINVSLKPSIGNWSGQNPYHAHYFITNNKINYIQWCSDFRRTFFSPIFIKIINSITFNHVF